MFPSSGIRHFPIVPFCTVGWRGGISPPRSHGSGRDSLPSSGSYHPAARLPQRVYLISWFLPSLVDQTIRSDDPTPSLHSHYRNFHTTTSWSAPVPRIGTLILAGPPLEFLPYHRNDRFPRSAQEPGSGSRYLDAGCRPSSKQAPLGLIPESRTTPCSDIIQFISTPQR